MTTGYELWGSLGSNSTNSEHIPIPHSNHPIRCELFKPLHSRILWIIPNPTTSKAKLVYSGSFQTTLTRHRLTIYLTIDEDNSHITEETIEEPLTIEEENVSHTHVCLP